VRFASLIFVFRNILFLSILVFFNFCSSAQKKDISGNEVPVANSVVNDFFSSEKEDDEAVKIFASSDEYYIKQIDFEDSIMIIEDTSGKKPMSEDIRPYDMVDLFSEAVYKVELFKDSGLISHIRPVKPSRISELNKIIIDDITRLKFKFKNPDTPEPASFKIHYGVQLLKKKSREEIKKILQENVHP